MFRTLLHTGHVDADGRSYVVHYFELRTARGGRRCSCELVLDARDRIILDDDSMTTLQMKMTRLVPALIFSRALASRAASVAA